MQNLVLLDKHPLSKSISPSQRAGHETLGPATHGRVKSKVTIFEMGASDCVYGALIGVVLGLRVLDDDDKACCFDDCDVAVDAPSGPVVWPAVRAIVSWCIGGQEFVALVDWLEGTQFGVVAERVSVCAEYVVLGDLDDPAACECHLPEFSVTAGVGADVRSHNSNSSRLTRYVRVDAPDGRRRVRVPPFAISVNALPIGADGGGPVSLELVGPCGPGVRYDIATPLGNTTHAIESALPIPNGVRFVDVVNRREDGAARVALVFGLAL